VGKDVSFGKRLKEARGAKKLTQEEAAKKLGIDHTTISKYENNKSEPDNETLQRLAELYGVSISYLYGENNKRQEENDYKRRLNEEFDKLSKINQENLLRFIEGMPKDIN
jgi:transcriptional regulator with XRE-family HTH domain